MRKKVYVCSPLRGDIEGNRKKAVEYCRFVYRMGGLPIAPHAYFTLFLNDSEDEQRRDGMAMGIQLLKECDELWVFGRELTFGMREELYLARQLGKKIHYVFGENVYYDPAAAVGI